jgi:pimeloyl-ACP methyl ester carboxylesterase
VAETDIATGAVPLRGDLIVPPGATGVVVVADGGTAGLRCAVNRSVAAQLREAGFGTLLVQLSHPHEYGDRMWLDLPRMSERLLAATDWLATHPETWHLRPGYMACSNAVGATLTAAATLGRRIGALVLEDGRADLAGSALPRITAPTLLLVGEDDDDAMDVNREALEWLRCDHRLHVIPGIGRIADEPAAAVEAARVVTDWFRRHLC